MATLQKKKFVLKWYFFTPLYKVRWIIRYSQTCLTNASPLLFCGLLQLASMCLFLKVSLQPVDVFCLYVLDCCLRDNHTLFIKFSIMMFYKVIHHMIVPTKGLNWLRQHQKFMAFHASIMKMSWTLNYISKNPLKAQNLEVKY